MVAFLLIFDWQFGHLVCVIIPPIVFPEPTTNFNTKLITAKNNKKTPSGQNKNKKTIPKMNKIAVIIMIRSPLYCIISIIP